MDKITKEQYFLNDFFSKIMKLMFNRIKSYLYKIYKNKKFINEI